MPGVARSLSHRQLSAASVPGFEAIERAMGLKAVDHFVGKMEEKDSIDKATIGVADPSNVDTWEWSADMNSQPKLTWDELTALSKSGDPFALVEEDVCTLAGGIKSLLGSDHPVLAECAKYFFEIDGGKKIRPTMILAVSYALNEHAGQQAVKESTEPVEAHDFMKASPSQVRLAEITEMIHTASLFHDDVIDKAETRRGVPSVNQVFGNKLAILGGDFMLARASISLARLRDLQVVELMSASIEHLVKGEIMQMKPSKETSGNVALESYLRKNFYKTASLMGHSCLAAAVLGDHSVEGRRAAYLYGTYLGQAFQLIDDALDFEDSSLLTGKAPLADLKSGLATAPALFAAEEHPKLSMLISRKFDYPGDIDEALELVKNSAGLQRCKDLAQVHAEQAIEAIQVLAPSPARDALVALACKVVTRKS